MEVNVYQATITEREAGQRFDKYLRRILPNAGSGFLHKMLRKKNITLNDKKADGSEKIAVGDCVKIFFAQETLDKFMGGQSDQSAGNDGFGGPWVEKSAVYAKKSRQMTNPASENKPHRDRKTDGASSAASETAIYQQAYRTLSDIRVIYENSHIVIVDKPAGILSQKAEKTDLSLNEWLIGYLLKKGDLSESDLSFYKPSVCNRLDRNTSGMVLCAKTLQGAQLLGALLKDRTLHKYYQLFVKGHITEERLIAGYLVKDEKKNRVMIQPHAIFPKHGFEGTPPEAEKRSAPPENRRMSKKSVSERDGRLIQTRYKPLRIEQDKTLLEVELITGKPHQIRAHLAGIGHPLLGDYKYGDSAWNEKYRRHGVRSQLLHAYKVVFPPLEEPFADLSGRTFYCEVPEIFGRVSHLV